MPAAAVSARDAYVLESVLPRDTLRIVAKFLGPRTSPPPTPKSKNYSTDYTGTAKQISLLRNSPKLTAMGFYGLEDEFNI
jgi:hypothetical protein